MGTRTDLQIRQRCERRVGALIDGKYLVEGLLGFGATGAVYRAHNQWAGRTCAVKIFHYQGPDEQVLLRRFVREARTANRVTRDGRPHPNVASALDVGRDAESGCLFIVQELLEGETLGSYLDQQPGRRVGPSAALEIMLPILDAIGAAHGAGIVHRDLKPENIFLAREGDVMVPKVLDFGIAKLVDDRMTPTSEVMGTPEYMAPEAFRGVGDVDARADLWAIGVILYEMLSGTSPFCAPSRHPVDALRRILVEEPVSLVALDACDAPLWSAIRSALVKDVSHRVQSASALSELLCDALEPARELTVPDDVSPDALRDALYRDDPDDVLRGAVRASLAPDSDEEAPIVSLADDPSRSTWSVVVRGSRRGVDSLISVLTLRELSRRVALHLVGVPLGDDGLARLLDAGVVDGVCALSIRDAGIASAGVESLMRRDPLRGVVRLDLSGNALGGASFPALLRAPLTRDLRTLTLARCALTHADSTSLSRWPGLAQLTRLDLSQNELNDLAVRALLESEYLPNTLSLSLKSNRLSDELRVWAQRHHGPKLARLVL